VGDDLSNGNDRVRVERELVSGHWSDGELAHDTVSPGIGDERDTVERHGSASTAGGDKRQLVRYSLPWSGARARTEVVERSLPNLPVAKE
jgi:hypothetical protein